jgi:hypothetical protein
MDAEPLQGEELTHAALVLACVLRMTGDRPVDVPERCDTEEIEMIAFAVLDASRETGIPAAILAADGYRESRFKKHAVGPAGEIGIWQLKRHGAIQGKYLRMSRRQLEGVELNALLAAEYLAKMRDKCPAHYLSRYNGNGCCTSRYERAIKQLSKLHQLPGL